MTRLVRNRRTREGREWWNAVEKIAAGAPKLNLGARGRCELISRAVRAVEFVRLKPYFTVEELVAALECHRRNAYRWLQALEGNRLIEPDVRTRGGHIRTWRATRRGQRE